MDIPCRNKAKPRTSGNMQSLVLFLLLPSLVLAVPYVNKPIQNFSGLYYEHLSQVKFQESHWDVITYFDISTMDKELSFVKSVYSQTLNLCNNHKLDLNSICYNPLQLLNTLIPKLTKTESDLKHLIGNHRVKRSWFDIVGKGLKTAFGTLDNDDAEYYNSMISKLSENDKKLTTIVGQQIAIVQTTIKNFNETINTVNKNAVILQENLIKINNITQNLSKEVKTIELKQIFDEHFSLLTLILTTLQNEITIVTNTVLLAKSNILHPSIITPFQLIQELSKTITFLPNSLIYPLPITQEFANKYIELSNIRCFFYNNRIGYIISVPLVGQTHFSLYQLIPLPVLDSHSKVYQFILPSVSYLTISEDHNLYLGLKNLDQCKPLSEIDLLCSSSEPIHYVHSRPICETELLKFNTTIPSSCEVKIIKSKLEIWHKLTAPNTWIYVLPGQLDATISCLHNQPDTLTISNTGILELNKNCKLYTGSTILNNDDFDFKSIYKPIIPTIAISNFTCCLDKTKKNNFSTQLSNLDPISLNNLNTINSNLNELKISTDNLADSENKITINHTNSINYILLLLFTCYILYKIFIFTYPRFKKYCSTSHHQRQNHTVFFESSPSQSQRNHNIQIPHRISIDQEFVEFHDNEPSVSFYKNRKFNSSIIQKLNEKDSSQSNEINLENVDENISHLMEIDKSEYLNPELKA